MDTIDCIKRVRKSALTLSLMSDSQRNSLLEKIQKKIESMPYTASVVVIDELDASIFEYLLGEILTMLTESGKGQLFFTSHNLYPLELLDKESIFFTTTNSQNRYIKFKYIKPNHNLRDQYLKTIRLGGQDEPVYQESDTANMRLSFYSAGRKFENFLKTIQEKN